ncbi:MAG: hypothetical protein WCZ72_02040 [Gemmobacter sp.]
MDASDALIENNDFTDISPRSNLRPEPWPGHDATRRIRPEGVPGFGFVIARKTALEAAKGVGHSLSLDVHAQWAAMEKTGQWRFTPPTHVVAAFIEALKAHRAEGGVTGRGARSTIPDGRARSCPPSWWTGCRTARNW